ncbi:hypothetical protein HYFRA_00010264 [Hymenoscyphus fraxineus]|uniref:Uncharacterized protein n=1 Tax=Hymenoscyphus fraxineus TaxID=746836 RepID=A0A9N9PTN7_9HELO|nr:hypothetical protein HYFRA_00010264 [Hymenoscyphus fraxineus]
MPDSPKISKQDSAALKNATKTFLSKFGPVIFTAAVAAAKHHLDEDERERERADETSKRSSHSHSRGNEADDRASDRTTEGELRRELRHLKRKLRKKEREVFHHDSESSSSKETSQGSMSVNVPTIIVNDEGTVYGEEQPRGRLGKKGSFERKTPRNDYYRHPEDRFSTAEQSEEESDVEVVVGKRDTDSHRPHHRHQHRHHQRNSSLPLPEDRQEVLQNRALEASKVAALAGVIEALHLSDRKGPWIGPKGKRVVTATAASFRTSWARGDDPELYDGLEMVANVARGLVVTRIIHGSSSRVEHDLREERRGRKRRRSF